MAEVYRFRACDALQLADAAAINTQATQLGFATFGILSMTLVSSDDDLNSAAAAGGYRG